MFILLGSDPLFPSVHSLGWGDDLHWAAEVWLHPHWYPAWPHHTTAPIHLFPHSAPGETCIGVQAHTSWLGLLCSTSECWWVNMSSFYHFIFIRDLRVLDPSLCNHCLHSVFFFFFFFQLGTPTPLIWTLSSWKTLRSPRPELAFPPLITQSRTPSASS